MPMDPSVLHHLTSTLATLCDNDTGLLENDAEQEDYCACHSCERARTTETVFMILVLGSAFSILGVLTNSVLLHSLYGYYRTNGRSPFLYLLLLAPCDLALCSSYFLLVVVRSFAFHFELLPVLQIWWKYVGWAYMVSQVSQSTGCFLILAATIERFLVTKARHAILHLHTRRIRLCFIAIILGVCTKFTTLYEFQVEENVNCTGLMEYGLKLGRIQDSWIYSTFYMVYVRSAVNVFTPFIVLAILNFYIVALLKYQHRSNLADRAVLEQKQLIRNATRTMVVIVCTYLISNTLNFALKVWEHIDYNGLTLDYGYFYDISADLTSLLTMAAVILRLPIYAAFNPEIRVAISSSCGSRRTTTTSAQNAELAAFVERPSVSQQQCATVAVMNGASVTVQIDSANSMPLLEKGRAAKNGQQVDTVKAGTLQAYPLSTRPSLISNQYQL